MTPAEEEKYVRDRWSDPIFFSYGWVHLGAHDGEDHFCQTIRAAYFFTLERENQIAETRDSIKRLDALFHKSSSDDFPAPTYKHVNGILQAALAELLKGWRQ
jgi:hypothetical protein